MTPQQFSPLIAPDLVEKGWREEVERLAEVPPELRGAVLAACLNIYARIAVAEYGRDEAGALIRGAAADAGASLSLSPAKPRASFVRHVLLGYIGAAIGWALCVAVGISARGLGDWLARIAQ